MYIFQTFIKHYCKEEHLTFTDPLFDILVLYTISFIFVCIKKKIPNVSKKKILLMFRMIKKNLNFSERNLGFNLRIRKRKFDITDTSLKL